MADIGKNTDLAVQLLRNGKLVGIPTETVYGLAAIAINQQAVLSVFEAKQRPHFDPLIIHLAGIEAVSRYAKLENPDLKKLAHRFWPGPLTLLLPKKELVPDIVTAGLSQVAVRIPDHPLTLELLQKLNEAVAAPSANPFGYISPTSPQHVNRQLGEKVAYILDGGNSMVGLESTIVGVEEDKICVYRLGGLALEAIEEIVGKVELRLNQSSNPKAPGQLKSHYAPIKPLLLGNLEELLLANASKSLSIIGFGKHSFSFAPKHNFYNLSPLGDFKEAALQLFKILRLADEDPSDLIVCEKLPDKDLGRAINDRLLRASSN